MGRLTTSIAVLAKNDLAGNIQLYVLLFNYKGGITNGTSGSF